MQDQGLRKLGLRVTVPRMKVLAILENASFDHLSAEDIYKKLMQQGEDVGLATIYRVLTQFETAGLVHRHNFEGGYSVYELNTGDHHDHLVCLSCGAVLEFCDELIERQQQRIAETHDFLVKNHHHTIYGVCKNCHE